MKTLHQLAAGLAIAALAAGAARAATCTWDGAGGEWNSNSPSWSGGAWTNGNNAMFKGSGGTVTIQGGFTPYINNTLTFSNDYTLADGTITQAGGGKIAVAAGARATLSGATNNWNTSALYVGGGGILALTNGAALNGGQLYVGNGSQLAGAGSVVQSGGTVQLGNWLYMGYNGQTGSYQLDAGSLAASGTVSGAGFIVIGRDDVGSRSGTATFIQNGGAVTAQRWYGGDRNTLIIGAYAGASYTMNGGSLGTVAWASNTAPATYVGYNGSGEFTLAGSNAQASVHTLTFAYSNGVTGTVNLEAGILRVTRIARDAGTAVFNLSGGTLAPYDANATITNVDLTLAGDDGTLSGADKDGVARTVTVWGVIQDKAGETHGLAIGGPGRVILKGVATYGGATDVKSGTLSVLSSNTGTGVMTIRDGAALEVTASGTARLAPAALRLGDAAGAAISFFNITSTSAPPVQAGTLALHGTNTVNVSGFAAGAGSYPLIGYAAASGSGAVVLGAVSPALTNGWAAYVTNDPGARLISLVVTGAVAAPGPVVLAFSCASTVSTNADGTPLRLTAELNYDSSQSNAPIMVVMHPFSDLTGLFAAYRDNAQRFRDAGFFVISPAMRQREGSDGVRDIGGVEIYDIYDTVEAVKLAFPALLDPRSVSITGYSGGGGNTMSALTKFPDYFRVGASYFGMSDYGYNTNTGWYFKGAATSHQAIMNAAAGNPTPPAASAVTDRYLARASNLASKNNPYSEIHLFVNTNETTCPPVNDTSYRDNALAAASLPGEFTNITVHLGAAGLYLDFNGNGLDDTDEQQYWPHGDPTASQQHAGDAWYLARLRAGQIPEPVLNAADSLFVAGFVRTKRFMLWLGDGQNAAGDLTYSLAPSAARFELHLASLNAATGRLSVAAALLTNQTVEVRRNGVLAGSFDGSGSYVIEDMRDGSVIELTGVPPVAITNLTVATGGPAACSVSGMGGAGRTYGLYASTNLSMPMGDWRLVGTTNADAGGAIQFLDTQATNSQLFYRLGP